MNLVDRVKKLMLQPKSEWQVIDGETHTVQGLYHGLRDDPGGDSRRVRLHRAVDHRHRASSACHYRVPIAIGRRAPGAAVRIRACVRLRVRADHRRAGAQLRLAEELHAGVEDRRVLPDGRVDRRRVRHHPGRWGSSRCSSASTASTCSSSALPMLMKTPAGQGDHLLRGRAHRGDRARRGDRRDHRARDAEPDARLLGRQRGLRRMRGPRDLRRRP